MMAGAGTFDVTLDPSLFVVGENLIAVHGINTIARSTASMRPLR